MKLDDFLGKNKNEKLDQHFSKKIQELTFILQKLYNVSKGVNQDQLEQY